MGGLGRKVAELKSGSEPLRTNAGPLRTTLLDFWKWSGSDLLTNAARGVFAEFLVASATGCDLRLPREAWGSFDLMTVDGIKLEVKSAAYLQSWNQPNGLSKISFSIKEALSWDPDTNEQGSEKQRFADVYVFCLLHHEEKDTVDPLNMDHWTFYVLSIRDLERYKRSRHSITLRSLQNLAQKLTYEMVGDEVRAVNARG
jgi:hypothetical protein